MEWLTIALFCAALLVCILLDASILYALAIGLGIFLLYGWRKGFSLRELARMCLDGIKTVKNVLLTFIFIGLLTAFWRMSGTIAVIVSYASTLIRPSVFLLMTFLLNCGVSALLGTAFGTSATIGVICATMGRSMGIDMVFIGGAVLSGALFGDRCSPVSSSALLVSALTETDIYRNIKNMLRTALVPFLLSCAVYAVMGLLAPRSGQTPDLKAIFGKEFMLHWTALLPAAAILLLAVLKVPTRRAMLVSILIALPLCLFVQRIPLPEIVRMAFAGYSASDAEVARMLDGGGVFSMVRVGIIVSISSAYSGIFRATGLLDGMNQSLKKLAARSNSFCATLLTSALSSMIACNQTLAIMLTRQLCGDLYDDRERMAIDLEDTAVILSPLVPWSIAGGVPLTSVGAPTTALLFACYLYLLPLWRLLLSFRKK